MRWTHLHTGGLVTFLIGPQAGTPTLSAYSTVSYDAGVSGNSASTTLTNFGQQLAPGYYTLRWGWAGYYNCVDLTLTAPAPTGARPVAGSSTQFEIENGVYDSLTETVTCDEGYEASEDNQSCESSGPSGGEIFGIILLVIVLVALIGGIVALVVIKTTQPAKWEALKAKVGRK